MLEWYPVILTVDDGFQERSDTGIGISDPGKLDFLRDRCLVTLGGNREQHQFATGGGACSSACSRT